ncbi:MAG: hypothetical protein ACRDQA_28925 [Nocardioidaceae bacterium]
MTDSTDRPSSRGKRAESDSGPLGLPLFNAKIWSIGFLVFAIVLAIVFAETMPAFFQAAYNIGH